MKHEWKMRITLKEKENLRSSISMTSNSQDTLWSNIKHIPVKSISKIEVFQMKNEWKLVDASWN